MKKAAMILILPIFASMTLLGLVFGNHGEKAYANDNERYNIGGSPMKTLIILGAGNFLKSYAGFQQFLHRVELSGTSGVNYDEWRVILKEAIADLQRARVYYYYFNTLAAGTPYNRDFTGALVYFEYPGFRETHHLNREIFSRLELLLRSGNVTGVYEEILSKANEITGLLRTVNRELYKDIFPGIPLLWKINQKYFNALLFGQYAAMIFNEVK